MPDRYSPDEFRGDRKLRLGRPSLGGVLREAPEGGCRACVRGGTDAPWPSATEKEGGMLAFARRPAETQGSGRPTLEAAGRFGRRGRDGATAFAGTPISRGCFPGHRSPLARIGRWS